MSKDQLSALYDKERNRLAALIETDKQQGEYNRPVFGEGSLSQGVMFIGEAPGANETEQGRPFVGKAGKQLDELLEMAGIARENVFITNTVKYRPCIRSEKSVRNRTPAKLEILEGMDVLREEICIVRPVMVVTLGNVPLQAVLSLCGMEKGTIGDLHGTAIRMSLKEVEFILFPCYHPASGIYNRSLVSIMEQDAISMGCEYRNLIRN